MEPLITQDLCLRPFEMNDSADFVAAALESTSTIGAWMPWCHDRYSDNEAQSWFEECAQNLASGFAYDFGIFSADGKELFGGIAINQLDQEHNFGNVGYWVRQTRQRQGIAFRAVETIVRFGFGHLGLTRLEIVVAEKNEASRRVAEKVGAILECVARNRLIIRGQPCDAAVYSLVPRQYGF
ncbi:MAG: GNAT family protein [Pseudomonadota bacterium]